MSIFHYEHAPAVTPTLQSSTRIRNASRLTTATSAACDFVVNGIGDHYHLQRQFAPYWKATCIVGFLGLSLAILIFGQVVNFINDAKPPHPVCFAKGSGHGLNEINDYAGQFHHDTNPGKADTVVIVPSELRTFAERTLNRCLQRGPHELQRIQHRRADDSRCRRATRRHASVAGARGCAARGASRSAVSCARRAGTYVPAPTVPRQTGDVMVEPWVREALIRLNPEIAAQPDRADEVIYNLRAMLLSVQADGLVRANENFMAWLRGEKTMPFGPNGEHVTVRLVDADAARRTTGSPSPTSGPIRPARWRSGSTWSSWSTACRWSSARPRRRRAAR